MRGQKLKHIILLVGIIMLEACSGSSGSSHTPGDANVNPDATNLQNFSVASYQKESDLTEEDFKQQSQGFEKSCDGFDQFVQVGSSFQFITASITSLGTSRMDVTDTITSVTPTVVKSTQSLNSFVLSYFQGDVFKSNTAENICRLDVDSGRTSISCAVQSEMTDAYQAFLNKQPPDEVCVSNGESSTEPAAPPLVLYEKGTYTLNDGRSISVLVRKEQEQKRAQCGDKEEQVYTTSSVVAYSAQILTYADDNICGRAEVYKRDIVQDAAKRVVSDFSRQMVQGPAK